MFYTVDTHVQHMFFQACKNSELIVTSIKKKSPGSLFSKAPLHLCLQTHVQTHTSVILMIFDLLMEWLCTS